MKYQILALLLIALVAVSTAHNPNKKKNKMAGKKFGCFAQCKDECESVKNFKKTCFIPCKKECDKGDKDCKKACRAAPCESAKMSEEDVAGARTKCKTCKQECRPVFRQCWEDNCKTECPTKRSKKQRPCKVCLKKNCGGVMEDEDQDEAELLE